MPILKNRINRLFAWGTELSGLDLKYFIGGATWLAVSQGFAIFFGLLLTIAFANLLPKETYGLYTYLLSLTGFFSIFTLSGMNAAVLQAVASGNDGVLKSSVRYQLKWNTAMTAVLLVISGYYFWHNNYVFALSLLILGITTPLTSAFNTYGAFLNAKRNFKTDSLYSIWSTGIYSLGMFLALLASKQTWWLVLAYSLITLGTNFFFYIKTVRAYDVPETKSPEMIKYGWQLTFINFIYPIVTQIDKIVLGHFYGPVELAVYFLARSIPDRIYSLIKTLISVGLPKLAKRSTEEINSVFIRRTIQGFIIGVLIAAAYIIAAPIVFKYILPKYLESVHYSQLLAITFIFAAPARYLGSIFTIKKIVRPAVIATLINNTIRIILFIVLGIWGGIMGLVIAELIFQIIAFFINIATWKLTSS